jgi:two-component system NtrC family sensor kinase
MRWTRSLRTRVIAILALAALVPAAVIGVLAITRAQRDLEREVARGNLALIRAMGAALDTTLQDARRTVELAAAAWADARTPATASPADVAGDKATDRLLRRLRREVPVLAGVSLVEPGTGRLVAGDPVPAGTDLGAHSFGGYVGDVDYAASPASQPSSSPATPSARLVLQARSRTGELVAIVVATLDLGFVADAVGGARLPRGARVIVVDGAGRAVARTDGAPVGPTSLAPASPAVARALGASVEGTVSSGGWVSVYRNLASYQSSRGVRWAIVLEQPEAEAYALARAARRDTILVGLVAVALAILLGGLLASRLVRPLSALSQRADAIAKGDVAPAPAVGGPGEIAALGARVEEMAQRLAERAELKDALARGDRLASVGVMSAQVAHEINNPLTTVLGYAKLLLEDKPEGHPDRAGLELIASEAERMKAIVGGLLDYARSPVAQAEGVRPTDVAAIGAHVAALVAPALKKAKVSLALDLAATPPVAMDAGALQQVLVNLVQNAIQALAPGGGTIAIAGGAAPGGIAAVIRVTDDGPGVPAADRARIFDPFFTTKAAGVGTGLGLAVCKHLVSRAGGTIEVGAGPGGRGAELKVVVPAAAA